MALLTAIGAIVIALVIAMGAYKVLEFLRSKAETSEEKKD